MRRCVTALLIAILLGACGSDTVDIGPRPPGETTTSSPAQVLGSTREKGRPVAPLEPRSDAITVLRYVAAAETARLWREAHAWIEAVERAEEVRHAEEAAARMVVPGEPRTAASSSSEYLNGRPCGGVLPPCWVLDRESGGVVGAVNPDGCGGPGCFTHWQFAVSTWEWIVKELAPEWTATLAEEDPFRALLLSLPAHPSAATPEQADAAAIVLYNLHRVPAAGCSHWSAC